MNQFKAGYLLPVFLLSLHSATASAAMGNGASSYGLMPHDVGTAQAFSLFNPQSSAAYYNPSALARKEFGELTLGYTHAKHELELKSLGGPEALEREGSVYHGDPAQLSMIGLKTNLTKLTTFKHPVYFGAALGLERFIKEVLSFDASTTPEGQNFTYGRQPLFATLGIGTKIGGGLSIGFGMQMNLKADAEMVLDSELDGETSKEVINLEATPVLRPTFGLGFDLGEAFCPDSDCVMDNFELALGYRGYSKQETKIDATAYVGTLIPQGLPLVLNAIDSFQPATTSFGILTQLSANTRIALSAEVQEWSRLNDEFSNDAVRDQIGVDFEDITVPRLGIEYDFAHRWGVPRATAMAGIAFEKSPLPDGRTADVNYLDNDKTIFALGIRFTEPNVPLLAHTMQLEFGYQYHMLDPREFDLYRLDNSGNEIYTETVEAEGHVHVLSASFSLIF